MKFKFLIFGCFLCLVFINFTVYSQDKLTVGPSSVSLGNYQAKKPQSLEELPKEIRQKLETHLKSRLGEVFYSKLKLSGGQIVDFEELYKIEPNAKNYQWKVFTYRLTFMFSEPEKGIEAFHAAIELDFGGNVIKEIELPEIAKNLQKANIFPLSEAKKIAKKKRFPLERTLIELYYNSGSDSLEWSFKYKLKGDRFVWTTRYLQINAHTGEILSIGNSKSFF